MRIDEIMNRVTRAIQALELDAAALRASRDKIALYVEEALFTDGAHHKQWYLEQIADELGIEHEKKGIAP